VISRRYRVMIATAGIGALVAVGGMAVAEQGGQSTEHRQNPTTTSESHDVSPHPTSETEAPEVAPSDSASPETDSNRIAALCHALHEGSAQGQAMKAEHGEAFQGLDCTGVADPGTSADDGDTNAGTEGPPANSNAGGNAGEAKGHGEDTGSANAAHGQSHKP
jgi:hypothetical protein